MTVSVALLTTEYMKMVYRGLELKVFYNGYDRLEFISYLLKTMPPSQALLSLERQTDF